LPRWTAVGRCGERGGSVRSLQERRALERKIEALEKRRKSRKGRKERQKAQKGRTGGGRATAENAEHAEIVDLLYTIESLRSLRAPRLTFPPAIYERRGSPDGSAIARGRDTAVGVGSRRLWEPPQWRSVRRTMCRAARRSQRSPGRTARGCFESPPAPPSTRPGSRENRGRLRR